MPKLYVLGEDSQPIAKYGIPLNELSTTIGRSEENNITIDHSASISSRHGVIRRVLGGFIIQDLDSSNGIAKNGKRVKQVTMRHAAQILVGDVPIQFMLDDHESLALAKETDAPDFIIEPEHLSELEQLHNGTLQEVSFYQQAKAAVAPAPVITPKLQPSAQAPVAPKQQYAERKQSNPALGFFSFIILSVIGVAGGLYYKHYQTHSSDLYTDFMNGKVKTSFNIEITPTETAPVAEPVTE